MWHKKILPINRSSFHKASFFIATLITVTAIAIIQIYNIFEVCNKYLTFIVTESTYNDAIQYDLPSHMKHKTVS